MNETNSLAISVGVLAGVSVWVTGLLSLPTWLVFLAWLTFFFCGLGKSGLILQLSSNLWGIFVGAIALYALSRLPDQIFIAMLVIAVSAFTIAQSARVRFLSQSPGSFVGFAMIAAAVQTTALPIDNVTVHGPIAVAVGAAVLGSLFGIASQLAAFAIRTATGGRDAHRSGDQMLLREE
ncbi:DUF1097 domain-containing protein [Rhodococcus sp. 27YEA15]|uniref:DUF1097 domain-containing protein n=1 Tax=Rhodococcus sp. 27YEA15 TaxID=3156259 RepID=UPI003C7ECC8B